MGRPSAGGRPFAATEYEGRWERLGSAMREQRLDGLLLTEMADLEYVTGYTVRVAWSSYTRLLAVLVPASGTPVMLVPGFLEVEAGRVTGLPVRSYDRIDIPPIEPLADLVSGVIGTTGRLGMELGGETRLGMPVELVGRLAERLPTVELVDGSSVVLGARLRKSDAEIERLARACAANTHAFRTVFAGSLEGVTEDQVARRLVRSALDAADDRSGLDGRDGSGGRAGSGGRDGSVARGGSGGRDGSRGQDGSGGWIMPGWVAITSGEGGYDRFLGHPRPRTLEVGDMIWADLGMTVDGYWSDFCRAAVVGGPTAQQRDQQDRILAATADGVAVARPGMRASDVAAAVARGLERVGLPSFGFGRVGHGIGLTATEIPHIAAYDSTVLERGMVVTVEPASVAADGLYCAEQVVVVDDPPRILSLAPGDLGSV